MPYRSWRLRVEDILDALRRIARYTEGMDFESFRADDKTVDAVVRNIQIIGEAAKHVPENLRQRHSEVPWDKLRAMRNVVVHEYFGVSASILWHAIREDLPPVIPLLRAVLGEKDE